MILESRRARRTLAVLGILWNATIVVIVVISAAPALWKAAGVVYGGFAMVVMGLAWSGRDDLPRLRIWQNIAFLIAAALLALGAFVFRS